MIKILFIHTGKAIIPEIKSYISYFNNLAGFSAFESTELKDYNIDDYDVIWEFKGIGGVKRGNYILVHDYNSLSTGTLPRIKDKIKKIINTKPDLRIFLNKNVYNGFAFNDGVDYCFRDMGINPNATRIASDTKEYDFVYLGAVSKSRKIDVLLDGFVKTAGNSSLCLIGKYDDEIYQKFGQYNNLIFTGLLPYEEVPKVASKAQYAINYMPNKYPFNVQTSTKLLDYVAMGLKVITTDYKWINEFERENNCKFYRIDENNPSFSLEEIQNFDFISQINVHDFLWDSIIENAGVADKICTIMKGKQ